MAGRGIDPLIFPGFRLIVEIGRGEGGEVWRARELESQRLVALKVYRPELVRRPGFASALDQAVLAARGFSHPACAQVYGLVEARSGGGLALIGELLGGEVLARALQRNVRFSPERALRLARQLAGGLDAAGTRRLTAGVLHPGHVVVSGESARMIGLGTSAVEGLPGRYDHSPEDGRFAAAVYAASEVISGGAPDRRSDVFALGALLYHMLTGLAPYKARDLAGLKLERAEGLRWPRGADSLIPSEALGLVGRSMENDPALRPSAADFAAAAGRALAAMGEDGPADAADDRESTRVDLAAVGGGGPSMPPAEPSAPGARGRPARPARLRDALIGAAAATLLIGAGVALGRYAWTPSRPEVTPVPTQVPEQGPSETARPPVSRTPSPDGRTVPDAAAAEDEAARREYEAVLAVLAEKPAASGAVRERLAELARRHSTSQWGLRAGLKLAELNEADRLARAAGFARIAERAAALEKRERFGEAAALFEKLPADLAEGDLPARAAAEAAAVLRRAAERYEAVARRAERSVADGDLAAAMLDYKRVVDEYGVPAVCAEASRRLGELGRLQEQNAQDLARRQAEQRRLRADEALRSALESARASLVLFRHAQAIEAVEAAAAGPDQPEDSRKLLTGYRDLIRGERKLFELASRRVAGGIRELNITVGDSEVLTVKKLDEKGLVADGNQISGVVFTWERISKSSPYQAYLAVKKTIDLTSAEEQMQLATCAFHHDQPMEVENCLKVAAELDPAQKDAAAAQRELLRRVEAVLKARREAGDAPRRRTAEDPAQ
ncbi:MAG TPA: protein kinase [Planctomycetota bacterium]|nr:protein kinase [Planctomycetota bacterium]